MSTKTYGTDATNPADLAYFRRLLRKYKPSPQHLAQTASPLLSRHKGDYMRAIMEAAHLLAICGTEINEANENLSLIDQFAFNPSGVEIPRPGSFPISFFEMLRLLMPGTDKADDRQTRFRHYLKETLTVWAKPGSIAVGKADLVRAGEWIADAKKRDAETQKNGLPGAIDDSQYLYHASNFLLWQKRQRSKTGRNNVLKRKIKRKAV